MHKGFILATALVVAFGAVPNNHGSAMTRQQAYTYAQQRHAQQEKEAQIAKRYEQAIQAYQSGNYSVCINYLSNNYVAAAFQRKTDYNIAIGDSYYKLGKYNQATPYLKRAYNMGARNALVNLDLGMSFYKMDLAQEAIPYLQATTQSNLATGDSLWALADAYSKVGNQDNVQPVLELIASRFPGYKKEVYAVLANKYFEKNDVDAGVKIALRGLQYFSNDGDLLYWVGHGYFAAEKYDQAIQYLEQSNQVIPNNIDTLYDLGSSYLALDRLDDASACVDRMMAVNKDHPKTQDLYKAVSQKIAQKQMEQQMQMNMMNQAMQAAQDAANQGLQQGADAAMDNAAMENPAMQPPAGM